MQLAGEARRLLAGREYHVPAAHVLDLVAHSTRSAYDCEYAALARELSATLVSSDARLVAAFPELAVSLQAFTAGQPGDEGPADG